MFPHSPARPTKPHRFRRARPGRTAGQSAARSSGKFIGGWRASPCFATLAGARPGSWVGRTPACPSVRLARASLASWPGAQSLTAAGPATPRCATAASTAIASGPACVAGAAMHEADEERTLIPTKAHRGAV
jgi:hypothetical protein